MNQQTQRRLFAAFMFVTLSAGGIILVFQLVGTADTFQESENGNDYVKGVILTALSGALGSILTLLGIIVKGVMDNLTAGTSQNNNQEEVI